MTHTLSSLGYNTGINDTQLKFAVAAFQREHGLVVDGVIGKKTQAAMDAAAAGADGIVTSKLFVGDIPFVTWFNTALRPTVPGLFPTPLSPIGFHVVFDHARLLTMGPAMHINEFVALLCIFYNETGGKLASMAEFGGPAYCFGTNNGKKASYNTPAHGNRRAGTLLLERGFISTPNDVAIWNSNIWPKPPTDSQLYAAALECDFYKYRGHGLCQVTWRDSHIAYVDPALALANLGTCESLTTAELDQAMLHSPEVYVYAAGLFFNDPQWGGPALAFTRRGDFTTLGKRVSGSGSYAVLFDKRCRVLLNNVAGKLTQKA